MVYMATYIFHIFPFSKLKMVYMNNLEVYIEVIEDTTLMTDIGNIVVDLIGIHTRTLCVTIYFL